MVRRTLRLAAVVASSLLAISGLLLTASSAAAEGATCPALTRIKYPFIQCAPNEYGGLNLSIPQQPEPLACHLQLKNGDCGASPEEWRLYMPIVGPGPSS